MLFCKYFKNKKYLVNHVHFKFIYFFKKLFNKFFHTLKCMYFETSYIWSNWKCIIVINYHFIFNSILHKNLNRNNKFHDLSYPNIKIGIIQHAYFCLGFPKEYNSFSAYSINQTCPKMLCNCLNNKCVLESLRIGRLVVKVIE